MKHARTSEPSSTDTDATGGASAGFLRLADLPKAELDTEFLRGTTPDLDDLAGWDFRGLNHAKATKVLGIRKFMKGFYLQGDELFGYNLVAKQNPLAQEWTAKPSDDSPKRHGFYKVRPVLADEIDNAHLHAVLLDYGQGENPRFDVTKGLRDYLVQIDDNVFLGKAYYALGKRRLSLPSYFILDRFRRGMSPTP